jgi:hypothetical protein
MAPFHLFNQVNHDRLASTSEAPISGPLHVLEKKRNSD